MSEIEEIFASKGKAKIQDQHHTSSKSANKKKNKNKATQVDNAPSGDSSISVSKKRPPPETILDSSFVHNKRSKIDTSTKYAKVKNSQSLKDNEYEAKFKDSRGTGPRRTTEEGWPIYNEEELGICEEGGETPLCPFDCNCCSVIGRDLQDPEWLDGILPVTFHEHVEFKDEPKANSIPLSRFADKRLEAPTKENDGVHFG